MRDSPAARMKSKAPNEMPFSACRNASSGLIGPWRLFPWILHAGDLVADHADRLLLHLFEHVLLGEEAGAVHLVARAAHAELVPRLDVTDRIRAGEEGVDVLGRLRLELRDERQEVVVAERRLQGAGHFAAAL